MLYYARFGSGVGVQAHARTGSLLAIREALGEARKPPAGVQVPTKDRDFFERPTFDALDGLSVEYDVGGNLVALFRQADGRLEGPFVAFNGDGSLSLRQTCCYRSGRVVSKLLSDIPDGFVAGALRSLVVPVKKALGIGLAPGEEALCAQHGVDAEGSLSDCV